MPEIPPILVIGNAAVDALATPLDSFPPPGGTRQFDELIMAAGGCGVNVAIDLARMGVPCDLCAPVGRGIHGEFLVAEIEKVGIRSDHLYVDADAGTPFTLVAVAANGERTFLHRPGANATFSADHIPESLLRDRRFVLGAGAMMMHTLDGEPLARIMETARGHGAQTLLDVINTDDFPRDEWKRRLLPILPHLDWFLPSRAEAAHLTARTDPDDMAAWLHGHGARQVVIKLGGDGALWSPPDGASEHIAALTDGRIVDATGAGDAWCAGFVTGLLDGLAVPAAIRRGHASAVYCLQVLGASAGIPPLDEIRRLAGA
ncbi:MAG: hypothetical protein CMJ83_17390 [Planctomycetes bacterium]|nr:hypothetical protein [Planctomycetota bacterium]